MRCISHPQETDRRIKETEERERRNLSRVLLEERSWFCGFITAFGKVLVSCAAKLYTASSFQMLLSDAGLARPSLLDPQDIEIGMVGDLERLQVIQKDLTTTISRPSILPETTRVFVEVSTCPRFPSVSPIPLGMRLLRVPASFPNCQYFWKKNLSLVFVPVM